MDQHASRRNFLKLGLAAGFGGSIRTGDGFPYEREETRPSNPFVAPALERVRIGFVGIGGMGTVHVNNLVRIDGAQIRAVCDIVEEKVQRAQAIVEKAGFPRPAGYS